MESGRFDEGAQLIAQAYGELRENHRRDRYSIHILSRLVWAHWLLEMAQRSKFDQVSEELPVFVEGNYRKWKCDPWTWIENIQEKASKRQEDHLKNQNPIEPLFDQGHYRDNSNDHSTNTDISEFLLLEGLSRNVGIPLRVGSAFMNVNLLAGTAEKLMLSGGVDVELWAYALAIRAASSESSPSIKGIFTRIGVARASQEVVDTLTTRILLAMGYWREKRSNGTIDQRGNALSALRVLIEVLARLVIRVSPEKAKEIFRLSVAIGQQRNLQHHCLFDGIDSLLTHSLKSIPESEQGDLLADALAFPLQSEVMNSDFPRCPNPVIKHPDARETYPGIEKRVGELIEALTPSGSISGQSALLRLLPLAEKEEFLTPTEREKLANALWGSAADYQTLPNIADLFPHALLLLPKPDADRIKSLVSRHLYEHAEEVLTDTQRELRRYPSPEIHRAVMIYGGIANAAANETTRLFPTPEQALALFDRLMAFRPQIEKDGFLAVAASSVRKQLMESIGNALSYAIAPTLSNEAKTVKRFEQLKALYEEVEGTFFVIPAFVYFAPINETIASTVEKIIRQSLQGRAANEVAYAAIALQKWMELPESTNSLQLNSLITRLIVIVESGRTVGLQQLLWVAGELFKRQRLSEEQVATLIEAIPNAFNAADYANIDPNSQEAISASSIREACVKLANTLVSQHPNASALQSLLRESKTDALPEVRFAIDQN